MCEPVLKRPAFFCGGATFYVPNIVKEYVPQIVSLNGDTLVTRIPHGA